MFDIMEYVLWAVSLATVLGSVLNIKKLASCFVVWTICNVFWLVYDLVFAAYARALQDLINLATSVWGMVEWFKPIIEERRNKTL